jgi:hypothetical protein
MIFRGFFQRFQGASGPAAELTKLVASTIVRPNRLPDFLGAILK